MAENVDESMYRTDTFHGADHPGLDTVEYYTPLQNSDMAVQPMGQSFENFEETEDQSLMHRVPSVYDAFPLEPRREMMEQISVITENDSLSPVRPTCPIFYSEEPRSYLYGLHRPEPWLEQPSSDSYMPEHAFSLQGEDVFSQHIDHFQAANNNETMGRQNVMNHLADLPSVAGDFYSAFDSSSPVGYVSDPSQTAAFFPNLNDILGASEQGQVNEAAPSPDRKVHHDEGAHEISGSTSRAYDHDEARPLKRRRSSSEDEIEDEHNTSDETLPKAFRLRKRFKRATVPSDNRKDPWNDESRPKYTRKNGNENARYRMKLRLEKQATQKDKGAEGSARSGAPESVVKLFQYLTNEVVSKRDYYYRQKSRPRETAATPTSQPATPPRMAGQAAYAGPPQDVATPTLGSNSSMIAFPSDSPYSQTTVTVSPTDSNVTAPPSHSRRVNRRQHVPVEVVREVAPEGWDPYFNDYYSGDDDISEPGNEVPGKASAYKPPRMACRRCNKQKQPCDHAYPSCSACARLNQRCRYRDDLTGRQIKPGQLEEVEYALTEARKELRMKEDEIKRLEERLKVAER